MRDAPRGPLAGQARVFAVIAVGGALGALGRYGIGLALPSGPATFPLATFLINVVGCLLIGGLIVVLTGWTAAPALARPFLATGVLGGFTTFSAYAVDALELLRAGRIGSATAYLGGTLLTALVATWLGAMLARLAVGTRPGGRR